MVRSDGRNAVMAAELDSDPRNGDLYRLLAENAWDVIWTMGLDGSITYVSPSVERVRGISVREAMVQSPDQINPPESAAIVAEYLGRLFTAIANGVEPPEFRGELEYYRRDGSIMTGELQVIPNVDDDGNVVEILGVTRDISERKRYEAAEARYRKLIDNSVVATGLVAPDGGLLLVNKAMCDLVGYGADELLTMNWRDLAAPNFIAKSLRAVADLVAGQRDSCRTTNQFVHADGHRIWGDVSLSSIRKSDGEAEYLVAQIVDITDQVGAQSRLAEREQQNRALAERLRAELDSAASYVASILPGDLAGPVRVSSRYLPSQEVGGDCFDYTWIDDDHLIVYLIDVSGHGVAPALVSVSVHNMLRSGSISEKTLLAPDRVLAELNGRFKMDNQGGNYFTIWYGVYQLSSRTLCYAGAGHPPALVLAEGRATPLAAQSPPVGMFDDTDFTADCFVVPPGCQILVYSDGAFEVDLPGGRSWSLPAFAELCRELAQTPDWSLDELVERLRLLSVTHALEDDCALIRLTID